LRKKEVAHVRDIYDRVDKNARPKKDRMLVGSILLVIAVIAVVIWPMVWAARESWRFTGFVHDLTESVLFAGEHGGAQMTEDGETFLLPKSTLDELYERIVTAGMGKTDAQVPGEEPALEVDFRDGTAMTLWAVEITDKTRDNVTGIHVLYTDRDGGVYSYNTDKLLADSLLPMLLRNAEPLRPFTKP